MIPGTNDNLRQCIENLSPKEQLNFQAQVNHALGILHERLRREAAARNELELTAGEDHESQETRG